MSDKLQWYFETTKNTYTGANDSMLESFRTHPYYSIVRESIQNSMDVILDHTKPVEVRFEIISINQKEHPELFEIRKHIRGCLEFHSDNRQARELYEGMLTYLDQNPSIKILKVGDYNTKGMHYQSGNPHCPFISFVGEGISSKGSGSGGSFGFGKGAYYVPSALRTILVSTMIEDGNVFFQGRTRLASHKIDGETKGKDGVFKINEDEPITSLSDISPMFRRDEQGTDIYIVGLLDDPKSGESMVKSVLNNFWLAVHENRLDVEIKTDDLQIRLDESNLEQVMKDYFDDDIEPGLVSDIYKWNPKAYYKAVKYANTTKDFLLIEKHLPTLKDVRLYVYRKDGLMNRISYMRKPAMTVFKAGRTDLSGYAAVFVCDNVEGNEILRQMENPAHNEWKPENVRFAESQNVELYREARKELNAFIKEALSEIAGNADVTRLEIVGLSNYLTIPEELLEDSESANGHADNLISGEISDNLGDQETGRITTRQIDTKIKPIIIKPGKAVVENVASPDNEGEDIEAGGSENDGEGGSMLGDGAGLGNSKGKTGDGGNAGAPIPIRFRIAATKENGDLIHNLIIVSDKDYAESTILLTCATDNGEAGKMIISDSSIGQPRGNSIGKLPLKSGRNIVKVKFSDAIKYTLKISAYEN